MVLGDLLLCQARSPRRERLGRTEGGVGGKRRGRDGPDGREGAPAVPCGGLLVSPRSAGVSVQATSDWLITAGYHYQAGIRSTGAARLRLACGAMKRCELRIRFSGFCGRCLPRELVDCPERSHK